MKFGSRITETANRADFYFDSENKVITKEFNSEYIALSVKGEFIAPDYINKVFWFCELANDRGAFDDCETYEDLKEINI